MRNPRADVVDERRVVLDRVRPAHRREHPVARVLQRQDESAARSSRRGDEIDDLARAVHRLERADAEQDAARPEVGRYDVERLQQLDERRRRRQVAAVRAEVNAGQRDLLETGRRDRGRPAPSTSSSGTLRGASARRRDDAVGARLGAAGLHAQRERRAAGDARLDRGAARCPSPSPKRAARRQLRSPCDSSSDRSAACRRWGRPARRSAARRLRPAAASRSKP